MTFKDDMLEEHGARGTSIGGVNGLWTQDTLGPFRTKRLLVVLALLALAVAPGELGDLTRALMTDAYVQVSSFVAATLILFYGAERVFNFDIGTGLRNARRAQVPLAALLGAVPGCGGAVVVVAAYSSGNVGFGAVVAALTATMGDAAFLLIAVKPEAAAVVLPLSLVVGVLSGYVVDWLETADYRGDVSAACDLAPRIGAVRAKDIIYGLLALPGLFFGVSQLFQVDFEQFGSVPTIVALAGTGIGLYIWSTSRLQAMSHEKDNPLTRMAEETSFISIWVIGAYLAYDYVVTFTGLDIATMFSSVAVLLPLIGILIGFIPGCGPQVLVTTLYINGVVPFAALVGNAISNDGDALFPAIALNPRAAIQATAYSAVPAVIVAYTFYFFFPDFM